MQYLFVKNFVFRRNFMKNEEKQLLSIGEIAKSLDITRRMILNYEAKGLIEADKKEGVTGNRYYTVDTLTRIRTIRVFQNLGLSLDDIKKYLDEDADLRPMIARLEKIRDELNLNIEKLKERVKSDNDFEFRIMTVPAQTVFFTDFPCADRRRKESASAKSHNGSDAKLRFGHQQANVLYRISPFRPRPNFLLYCGQARQ